MSPGLVKCPLVGVGVQNCCWLRITGSVLYLMTSGRLFSGTVVLSQRAHSLSRHESCLTQVILSFKYIMLYLNHDNALSYDSPTGAKVGRCVSIGAATLATTDSVFELKKSCIFFYQQWQIPYCISDLTCFVPSLTPFFLAEDGGSLWQNEYWLLFFSSEYWLI